jgi:hypothetical protein
VKSATAQREAVRPLTSSKSSAQYTALRALHINLFLQLPQSAYSEQEKEGRRKLEKFGVEQVPPGFTESNGLFLPCGRLGD